MSFTTDRRSRGRTISDFSQLVWEKTPLFALAGISAAVTMTAQRADGTKTWYPLGLRIEYALVSYVDYMSKALWPARLSPFYPHPDYVPLRQAALAALVLVLVTAVTIANRRRRPYLLVGWLFFLGTLVPMLGLEGVGYQGKQGIADRYAYLPLIGLFIMICWAVAQWAEQKHLSAAVLRVVCVAVLLALGLVASRQVGYWQDNVTLWSHAVQVTDGNFLAENNLGKALVAEGRADEAVSHFYRAVAIYPDDPVGNLNIGIYEQMRGNFSAAIERYKKAISLTRDPELKAAAWTNMATAYRQLGDVEDARQSQDAAAKLRR
jgi:tetratricopeptide (TPR) repeat protein